MRKEQVAVALLFVFSSFAFSCATTRRGSAPTERERAVLQVAAERVFRAFHPAAAVVSETLNPANVKGVVSLPLARSDSLYSSLITANQTRLDLRKWLSDTSSRHQLAASELSNLNDTFGKRFPNGIIAFSKPVFAPDGAKALIWGSYFMYVPVEYAGPFLTPDDVVFRVERTPSGWQITQTYAYSPD